MQDFKEALDYQSYLFFLEELASSVYHSPDSAEKGESVKVKYGGEGSDNAQRRQNVKLEKKLIVNEHGKNNKCVDAKAKNDVKTKSESNAIRTCNDKKMAEEQHRLMYYIE